MASEQTALNVIGMVLWDPTPTVTDIRAQQLAFALGYPEGWRVVREIEDVSAFGLLDNNQISTIADLKHEIDVKSEQKDIIESDENISNITAEITESENVIDETVKREERNSNETKDKQSEKQNYEDARDDTVHTSDATNDTSCKDEPQSSGLVVAADDSKTQPDDIIKIEPAVTKSNAIPGTKKRKFCIVDRIYAGEPGTGCDMWFNHESAMFIAESWTDESTPFDQNGGHMLPRQPKFDKGDKVQVLYQDSWFDAKILKRKDSPEGYLYQVFYPADNSKQNKIKECNIRTRPTEKDSEVTATELGFSEGWKAYSTGNNKWKILSPDGSTYPSHKAGMDAYKAYLQRLQNEGDPPWRTSGNEYIGRQILWKHEHKASARRTVSLDQIGEITGYISETDVDKAGQPGFISDTTGKPARLYHIKFKDDPRNPYSNYLLSEQDLEEAEILECLIDQEKNDKKSSAGKSSPKKQRKS